MRIADLPAPQTRGRGAEAVNATPRAFAIAEVSIDEPSAAVPVLHIQEHISAQIVEQVVDVPAATSQEDIAESLRLNPQNGISNRIVPASLI